MPSYQLQHGCTFLVCDPEHVVSIRCNNKTFSCKPFKAGLSNFLNTLGHLERPFGRVTFKTRNPESGEGPFNVCQCLLVNFNPKNSLLFQTQILFQWVSASYGLEIFSIWN